MTVPSRARFDTLRAKYTEKREAWSENESTLRVKYSDGVQNYWLSSAERKKRAKLDSAMERAGKALLKYITEISPRDWSYGVPVHWLYEDLTYEDAIRPVNERLSVVPPLSYGSREHRT